MEGPGLPKQNMYRYVIYGRAAENNCILHRSKWRDSTKYVSRMSFIEGQHKNIYHIHNLWKGNTKYVGPYIIYGRVRNAIGERFYGIWQVLTEKTQVIRIYIGTGCR